MPPKSPLTGRLYQARVTPFICPNCRRKQAISTYNGGTSSYPVREARGPRLQTRTASTIPSVTAVNVRREVPTAFRNIHGALKALDSDAGVYLSTSQLQLALRGLESETAVTRVAVLGLNGQTGARRLAKTLLADPLAAEQGWERRLTGTDKGDDKALLLRYAENAGIDDRHPLVRTLSIPSPILQTHRIEILVYTINAMTEPTNEGAASFLVPNLEMSNTSSGTPATMTYPVHKALLYEEGLNRLGTFATIDVHTETGQEGRMFKGVIDWSWSTSQQRDRAEEPVSPINLALAEAAIETFRRSLDKSIEYEHMWFDAGMPALTAWLLEGTEAHPNSMKPAVRRLIQTICDKVDQGILREEVLNMQKEKAATVPAATKNIINQAITIWAENAHNELRERLNAAFASRSWRKTKWWQLFWRVDDVGYVTSEILQRAWLVEAEKEMIWICGRIHQSGLLGPPKLRPTAPHNAEQEEQKLGDKPPAPSAADLVPQASNFNEPPAVEQAWPQDMARARSTLSSLTVPPLQALSQSLILQTVSTNVLASSLSSLLYISVSTTSPYESGAIAATGLVYSLRRLQKQWETARGEWDVVIREEGRRVLRHTEKLMRGAVEDVQPEIDEVGVRERAIAREAVEKVREALNERRG